MSIFGWLTSEGRERIEREARAKRIKDGQPVRYLVVDDSVFARKNLARMIETFGGQVAGEADLLSFAIFRRRKRRTRLHCPPPQLLPLRP